MTPGASGTIPCHWLQRASLEPQAVSLTGKEGQYVLRRMTAADYPAVRMLLPLVSRCQLELGEEDLEQLLKQPTYIPFCCYTVAAPTAACEGQGKEGELCGFCELYILPHLGRAADGRLERVVVSPEFRGKGIATAMCQAVLRLAKEQLQLGRVDLTVEKADAKHIYTKLGFEPVSTETLRLQHKQEGVLH
ncbi:diamine acetyltransferase [Cyclospora cayetanensis]|uniref:Diamine acetyltransferase n=2 Tax=Cyclospora cayetanensis TaxID=88456 RepID=A0A6P5WCP2_9EIME|nr:diamine acetyltransferase [Cyclospora cayetanensis]OEH75689.1 acetyltransferase domain-containing protein [Cyclospora cayetanensis]